MITAERTDDFDGIRGLTDHPKWTPPTYLFDARGGFLYEEVTTSPEYYLAATETRLLRENSSEIAAATRPQVLIDMGCGSATKTRLLINAMSMFGGPTRYVPWDINGNAVTQVAEEFTADFPEIAVHPVCGDFLHDLVLPGGQQQLILFLGFTLGNLSRVDRKALLNDLARQLGQEDSVLFSVDLLKAPAKLLGGYAGYAPGQFFKNGLVRFNTEFHADFDLEKFVYHPHWNDEEHQVEHLLRSVVPQLVTLARLGRTVEFEQDEALRMGISAKPSMDELEDELATARLEVDRWWVDEETNLGLCLVRKVSASLANRRI